MALCWCHALHIPKGQCGVHCVVPRCNAQLNGLAHCVSMVEAGREPDLPPSCHLSATCCVITRHQHHDKIDQTKWPQAIDTSRSSNSSSNARSCAKSQSALLLPSALVPPPVCAANCEMSSVVVQVVVLALAALACVQLASAGCTNSTDWDYLTLVQQWPVVDCANPAACNPTDQYFTIHGVNSPFV